MTKELETIRGIIAIINSDDFKNGFPLPSERKLSSKFNVSRNTVRNALRKLEARGMVDIRKGSGCFVLCKNGYCQDWLEDKDADSSEELQNLLETRYLFEPLTFFLSAKRITKKNIEELEKCLIRLSRAIIGREKENIADVDAEFRRIIFCSSKNRFLIFTMNQLNSNNHLFFNNFDQLSEFERDSIFADYVDILNGLKKEDAFFVKEKVEKNILRMCELLVKYEDIKMPELIADAIKMNESNSGQILLSG
ncbi:MAG: GntR family transcriptional regulator [Thermodesulfobacteriota bacterium]|nr:GntR family transcriptional regulator [Thermodesulfobacteriota bacterium]